MRLPELSPLEREFLPPLLEIQESPPSPLHGRLIWTLVGLMCALLVWSVVGRISIVATAPGKFIPDGRVKEVQPLEGAMVKVIHVSEGQRVSRGDLLLELDPDISTAELAANTRKYQFNRLEQARLSAELTDGPPLSARSGEPAELVSFEERMQRARLAAVKTKQAAARAAVAEKSAALAAARATLRKFQETTAIAAEREASAGPLVDSGALSRVDYLQLKEDLARNRNDLLAQEQTVQQAQAAVTESERALEQVRRDRVADIYNDLNQKVTTEPALKGDLDKSRELNSLKWLRAPVNGVVQKVNVTTIGQVVSAGQSLVTIVPEGTPLVVEANVTNEDIGFLKVGQNVEVKVDTFPFQKYGALQGTLVSVSPDAEDKSSASRDFELRSGVGASQSARADTGGPDVGYVYKVRIRTRHNSLTVDGAPRLLQPGMTVQADITTDRRRVIELFLSPVLKYLNEGLEVR
jgi:hemolysin D